MTAVMDCILARFGHDRRELDRLAPVKMAVPSGSLMTIKYEGDEPMVQVRLQECFGLIETPKVAGGKVTACTTLYSAKIFCKNFTPKYSVKIFRIEFSFELKLSKLIDYSLISLQYHKMRIHCGIFYRDEGMYLEPDSR